MCPLWGSDADAGLWQMTGDDLRERLESLKEVVSHTLREKAGLEEELVRLREVLRVVHSNA